MVSLFLFRVELSFHVDVCHLADLLSVLAWLWSTGFTSVKCPQSLSACGDETRCDRILDRKTSVAAPFEELCTRRTLDPEVASPTPPRGCLSLVVGKVARVDSDNLRSADFRSWRLWSSVVLSVVVAALEVAAGPVDVGVESDFGVIDAACTFSRPLVATVGGLRRPESVVGVRSPSPADCIRL